LEYGVSDGDAFAVGLACGGTIRVLVEPLSAEDAQGLAQGPTLSDLTALVAARRDRRAAVWAVHLTTWQRRLSFGKEDLPGGPDAAAITSRLASDRSGCEGDWFLAIHNPPLRLIVVGAAHIAQALIPMAQLAGYDCQLIDPRTAFASPARFPGTAISHDWPDQGITSMTPDARTAIVTLTHDPKIDDPAILVGLASRAFYLGCLGSTRTHAKRLARLRAAGVAADQLQRLHAPVGLDIGARNPAEIAVAILAEITQCLRRGSPA
jgi:xanthine dehydrogenase accessory factor